jgi:hypothetical protein
VCDESHTPMSVGATCKSINPVTMFVCIANTHQNFSVCMCVPDTHKICRMHDMDLDTEAGHFCVAMYLYRLKLNPLI